MEEMKFGPKDSEHPSVGEECRACGKPFMPGDFTTLVVLGPGDDEEARKRRDEGRPYNAVGIEVHWDCSMETDAR